MRSIDRERTPLDDAPPPPEAAGTARREASEAVQLLAQAYRSRLFCRDPLRTETQYLQFKGGEVEALLEQFGAELVEILCASASAAPEK